MIPADIPLLADVQGLRHRVRADQSLRVWWEPSAHQRKAGAKPVDLSHLRPGEAVRRARQLAATTQQAKTPRGRSIDALIISYRESRFFTDLRSTTQESYTANLRAIADKWGPQPAGALTSAMMDIWYEALLREKGTHRALALLTMMRILMGFAETRGWIAKGSNPATNLRMTKPQPRDRVATDAERAAIWAAAATDGDVALPLALALLTGQRQTDILAAQTTDFVAQPLLVPGHVEPQPGYVWQLRQSKRGRVVPVPIMDPAAVALLNAAMAARTGPLVINTSTGRRFLKRNFAERWEAVRAVAAETVPSVANLQWRDLRRTVSVGLRTAGMGRDDAGDLLGNTLAASSTLAKTYTPATLATTIRAVGAITPLPQRKKA